MRFTYGAVNSQETTVCVSAKGLHRPAIFYPENGFEGKICDFNPVHFLSNSANCSSRSSSSPFRTHTNVGVPTQSWLCTWETNIVAQT